ncbi:MAG: hypothetical protein WCK06_10360, partial [Actinomycetota bacterium]
MDLRIDEAVPNRKRTPPISSFTSSPPFGKSRDPRVKPTLTSRSASSELRSAVTSYDAVGDELQREPA